MRPHHSRLCGVDAGDSRFGRVRDPQRSARRSDRRPGCPRPAPSRASCRCGRSTLRAHRAGASAQESCRSTVAPIAAAAATTRPAAATQGVSAPDAERDERCRVWPFLRADRANVSGSPSIDELAQRLAAVEVLEQVDAQLSYSRSSQEARSKRNRSSGRRAGSGPRDRPPSRGRRGEHRDPRSAVRDRRLTGMESHSHLDRWPVPLVPRERQAAPPRRRGRHRARTGTRRRNCLPGCPPRRPSCRAAASRRRVRCASSEATYRSRPRLCSSRVEPSISVKRSVTVPRGKSLIAPLSRGGPRRTIPRSIRSSSSRS